MKYATLCSGIGGFDLAFDAVGMECVFQCEIDSACQRVLAKHWPTVPKTMDVEDDRTAIELIRLRPDIIGFGSPCQDLSVAGKRAGLSGERSGLFFRCVELCFAAQARFVVFENVPGLLSSERGLDFAAVIAAFTGVSFDVPDGGWRNTGVAVGPLYSVAWAVLDAQWFGVPQRRRRVFVVADFGSRSGPYEILSLSESLPWDSPPRRKKGARVAAAITSGSATGSGVNKPGRRREDDVNTAEGHDASEDGTGRGTPLIPIDMRQASRGETMTNNRVKGSSGGAPGTGIEEDGDPSPTVASSHVPAVAYQCQGSNVGPMGTIRAGNGNEGGGVPFISQTRIAGSGMRVRRLLPVECLRLMGFPGDWLDGLDLSDSAKYRMCGNSVAVPVIEWIVCRIARDEP